MIQSVRSKCFASQHVSDEQQQEEQEGETLSPPAQAKNADVGSSLKKRLIGFAAGRVLWELAARLANIFNYNMLMALG